MTRIVVLGPSYPYRGGIASSNERMAYEFQKYGHEVKLFNFTLQYPSIFFPGKDQYHSGKPPKNLDIQRTLNSINPLSWIRTAKEIQKYNPQLIISRFWHPYLGPALGAVLKRVQCQNIVVVDNAYPHEKIIGQELLVNFFLAQVDTPVVMSKSVQEDLINFFPKEKIVYTPHPVYDNYGDLMSKEEAQKEIELDPDKKYILFFGLIRAYKGLDLLLEAFGLIKNKFTNINLLVAGEFYDDKEIYLKIIRDLQMENRVVIHDKFIPNDKVRCYFSACDLVAQTYKSATQSGITQIAVHFRKSMLLTKVGGLSEIIENQKHGYLVYPNKESISNAIDDFISNEREKQFEENIESLADIYSWSTFYKTLMDTQSESF